MNKNYEKLKRYRQRKRYMIYKRKIDVGECQRCGYDKNPRILHFHHLNPENKKFSVSNHISKSYKKLKKEMDKCELICPNCHAEEHIKNKVVSKPKDKRINKKYDKVIPLYNEGKTGYEISKILNVDSSYIYKLIKKHKADMAEW